jgi:DNA-binding LytR/AlgR family response regulator
MSGRDDHTTGYTLVFHDITDVVSADDTSAPARPDQRRQLNKIPTVAGQKIVLVDADDVLCIRSEGHYTRVCTATGTRFCNLAISDLETRLDAQAFMRVHRSHLVNLRAVEQLRREDGRLALQLRGLTEVVPVSRTSAPEVMRRLGVPAGPGVMARQG